MCSYNAAYGKPTCASDDMNNQMVRSDWGWDGFFVSDCTALELMQDVKWDGCQPPYSPGNCTPDPFPGGHNYTGWCGDKACPVNSKEGVGENPDASARLVTHAATVLLPSAAAQRSVPTEEQRLTSSRLIETRCC